MDGAERIALKHALLERLLDFPWATMSLVLNEVGIGTQATFERPQHEVAWESVADADDADLLEVQRILSHLDGALSDPAVVGPWQHDGALRMFISHLSAEKVFAEHLRDLLHRYA